MPSSTVTTSLALALMLCVGACLPRPPHMVAPYYNIAPGQADTLPGDTWLVDRQEGDRYAVAGEDLEWRDEAMIGPADDRTGRCAVDDSGRLSFVAPKTPGEWPCLLRACRETCWVSRLTLVVLPASSAAPAPRPTAPSEPRGP